MPGMAFIDGFGGQTPPSRRLGSSGFAEIQVDGLEMIYHDLPAEEGAKWVGELRGPSGIAVVLGGQGRGVSEGGEMYWFGRWSRLRRTAGCGR